MAEKQIEAKADTVAQHVQQGHVTEALKEVNSFYKSHNSESSEQFTNRFFSQIKKDDLCPLVAAGIFRKGSELLSIADGDNNGLDDRELKRALSNPKLTPLEKVTTGYMLLNSEQLAGENGRITSESLIAAAKRTGIPTLDLIDTGPVEKFHPPKAVNLSDRQALMQHMRETYGANFTTNGEVRDILDRGKYVCREPSLKELQVANSALERFGLAVKDGQGIKFVYLTGGKVPGLEAARAIYDDNSLIFPPGYNQLPELNHQNIWFKKDTSGPYRQRGVDVRTNVSVEEQILHELGHYDDEKRNPKGWRENNHSQGDLARRFGFFPLTVTLPGDMHMTQYGVEGRDGNVYLPSSSGWLAHTKSGAPVMGGSGQQLALDFDQMSARAKTTPGTIYWVSPMEASADAKTCLYIGGDSRASLLKMSPKAYEAVVKLDQESLDRVYGPGRVIRGEQDGRVLARSTAHLKAIKDFEESVVKPE